MAEKARTSGSSTSSSPPLSLNSDQALNVFSEILGKISRLTDLKTTLDEVLRILNKICECRHLAIRLIDSEGRIPIFAQMGLSDQFLQSEHWVTLDDCLCGHVARGRVDKSLPNFTEHGSFYSNSLKDFMGLAAQNKVGVPKDRLRGFCSDHGYESVAIIPIKFKDEIIAELYMSDEKSGAFPAETVVFMEKVSHQIGISIKNSQLFTQLEESQKRLSELLNTAPTGIIELDSRGDVLLVNAFGARLLGLPSSAELMKPGLNIKDLRLETEDWKRLMESVDSGETVDNQILSLKVKGETLYLEFSLTSVRDAKDLVTGYRGTFRDITDSVRLKEERREKAHTESLKNRYYRETMVLKDELKSQYPFDELIGTSPPMQAMKKVILQVASTDTTVLIRGETGTGKELVARYIHELSLRKDRILVKVNCAALSEGLITSELFGHEKGAFTGAIQKRTGRFEYADNATIFLDEIGDLPLETQAMLLRVLQDGEFERVGSSKTLKVNVRLIAATNRDLTELVKAKTFREDLYFRLNVFPIEVPPLRERKEDLPLLMAYFLEIFGKKLGKKVEEISDKMMQYLVNYDWPGNIRELQNIIEHSLIVSKGERLEISDGYFGKAGRPIQPGRLKTLEDYERDYLKEVLARTKGVIYGENGAAKILGLKPTTLQSRMKKLGMVREKA
jgi:formate hydrogenlyase transcriptional activator